MAFLDNSGDIILDAVLTDTGRMRLAQGNGSFKISKFALGDDEINYSLYNKSHSSGSAYYDLEILQTPVLEAFTNNASNLKTKLVSISRTNVLYMPVLKLNRNELAHNIGGGDHKQYGPSLAFKRVGGGDTVDDPGRFYIAVDKDTMAALRQRHDSSGNVSPIAAQTKGLLQGYNPNQKNDTARKDIIRVDQGLDTVELPASLGLDSDLEETAFIVEMDYRLGRIKKAANEDIAPVNFIDDDNIASYYLTQTGISGYVNPYGTLRDQTDPDGSYDATDMLNNGENPMVFEGPRGSTLHFRVQASQELQTSTYLFTQIGTSESSVVANNIGGFQTGTGNGLVKNGTTYYIDSTIRVIGANTGFRLDIPVRYVKIVY